MVTLHNVHNALVRFASRAGLKAPENYFANPATARMPPPAAPQPDPALLRTEREAEIRRFRVQQDVQLARFEAEQGALLERERMAFEQQLAQRKAQFEARLAGQKAQFEAGLAARRNAAQDPTMQANRPGGRLDL
jgi:hypothetical protein